MLIQLQNQQNNTLNQSGVCLKTETTWKLGLACTKTWSCELQFELYNLNRMWEKIWVEKENLIIVEYMSCIIWSLTNKVVWSIKRIIEYLIFTQTDIIKSGVLHFEFMKILILLFRQFYFVAANDCECEVEPWSQWSGTWSATCGTAYKTRQRVCSTTDGWTLGLSCHSKDHRTRDEYKSVVLPACRKFSLYIKLHSFKLFFHFFQII